MAVMAIHGDNRGRCDSSFATSLSSYGRWCVTILLLCFWQCPDVLASSSPEETVAPDHGIIDWVRSKGAIYHPAQELRTQDGMTGVFVNEDIPKGTVLASIPWNAIIASDDPEEDEQIPCGLVDRLEQELALGEKSEFAPYIEYVKKLPLGEIPALWTNLGEKLMQDIVDGKYHPDEETNTTEDYIPPPYVVTWFYYQWASNCKVKDPGNQILARQAAFIIMTRSDDAILIPGYDFYNHRNGHWQNADSVIDYDDQHVTTATRDIKKGEQIYISYNNCHACLGRYYGYGTGEMLRDYGFVETFPHRFWFEIDTMQVQFDLDQQTSDEGSFLVLNWDQDLLPTQDRSSKLLWTSFFRRHIRRLQRLRNVDYKDGNPGMPPGEWQKAWDFQEIYVRTMSLALEALQSGASLSKPYVTKNFVQSPSTVPHYDELGFQVDDLNYDEDTCSNMEQLGHSNHLIVENEMTNYQTMQLRIEPETSDIVLELDGVTQIASSYRPHYHEYFVHTAARYIDKVQRVMFIGGGDSMLLHEVLKYPDLELVVGLELDQTVTRKAFKYFSTQPHFEDPRVEWWFGDASKSLLLLPEDYWQSFDLVLVDFSETVMSIGATAKFNIFDALSLLLKPEGILVKNEVYMVILSKSFDYTVQIYFESPVICDQVLTMGSNKVDFFHSPVKDHGISTLLYQPMITDKNRFDLIHDYRQNDARIDGKCNATKLSSSQEERRIAGIVEIIDAEKVALPLDESLMEVFQNVAHEEGFQVVPGGSVYETNIIMISLSEGYILVRLFPLMNYCNIDINLWGRTSRLKSLSGALTKALGSEIVSNYRVVVAGMHDSYDQDRKHLGPQIMQLRNCCHDDNTKESVPKILETPSMISTLHEVTVDRLMKETNLNALVFCGKQSEECPAFDTLSKIPKIGKIRKLSTCSHLDASDVSTLYNCEFFLKSEWRKIVAEDSASAVLAIDSKAPKEMLQIVNSILDNKKFRQTAVTQSNIFMGYSTEPGEHAFRREFLDRYRKQHMNDPVHRAKFTIESEGVPVEFGFVLAGDASAPFHLSELENRLQQKLPGVSIDLSEIHGGKYAFLNDWKPKIFSQSDYDDAPGLQQYFEQKPLAIHTIVQLKETATSDKKDFFYMNRDSFKESVNSALGTSKTPCLKLVSMDAGTNGASVACLDNNFGTVVVTWDGRKNVDISFYILYTEEDDDIDEFIGDFLAATNHIFDVSLRDEMPRGLGRVVNCKEDVVTPEMRKAFYDDLLQRKHRLKRKNHFRNMLNPAPEKPLHQVQQVACSDPNADPATCRSDPSPLKTDVASSLTYEL